MQRPSAWLIGCIFTIFFSVGCQSSHTTGTTRSVVVPKNGKPLTIMSYNIRVGYGAKNRGVNPGKLASREKNLPAIVAAIKSIDPDIIGLQEVLGPEQAQELAKALKMDYAYEWHQTRGRRGLWWGVALLSKYPILKSRGLQISSGRGNTKSAVISTVDIEGKGITFFSIHKDKDLTDGSSFQVIMDDVNNIAGPIVLIGDFNMRPTDERLDILKARFIDTATAATTESARIARETGTFFFLLWGRRIDYVLVDRGFFNVRDAGIIPREHWEASDHVAYYARVALNL